MPPTWAFGSMIAPRRSVIAYSIDVDSSNFYSSGGVEDIYWTTATQVGESENLYALPDETDPWTNFIFVEAGVTITSATASIRWESVDPFNDPYVMQFVFYDGFFETAYDDHSFPGDGETSQSITLSSPYTFPTTGGLGVQLLSGTNPSSNSEAPRGTLVLTYTAP